MTPDTLETQNIKQEEDIFAGIETDEELNRAKENADNKVIAQTEKEIQQLENRIHKTA